MADGSAGSRYALPGRPETCYHALLSYSRTIRAELERGQSDLDTCTGRWADRGRLGHRAVGRSWRRPPDHLSADSAVGWREGAHDVDRSSFPASSSTSRKTRACPSRSRIRWRWAAVRGRATIQGDARVIDGDPHTDWESVLPLWSAKEPVILQFLKARVAFPLFFERSVIEVVPRRVLLLA